MNPLGNHSNELMRYVSSAANTLNSPARYILPSVCIAREAGARGNLIAHHLAEVLNVNPTPSQPWMAFESNLVNVILADYMLPKTVAKHMPEDKVSFIDSLVSHFMSDSPSDRELFEKTVRTIRRLLNIGHSIIIGRGSTFMSQDLPQVVKVLLTVSNSIGDQRISIDENISLNDAEILRKQRNLSRTRYIKTYLGNQCLKNPKFDLIINTDNLSVEDATQKIAEHVRRLEQHFAHLKANSN